MVPLIAPFYYFSSNDFSLEGAVHVNSLTCGCTTLKRAAMYRSSMPTARHMFSGRHNFINRKIKVRKSRAQQFMKLFESLSPVVILIRKQAVDYSVWVQ